MPRKLIYAAAARRDAVSIRLWLTQPGSTINDLRRFPCRYPAREHLGLRELPCPGGYRAVYQVNPDTGRNETAGDVSILRIFGPGQSRARF